MPLRLRFLAFVASLLLVPATPCAAPGNGGRAATLQAGVPRAATFRFSGTVAEPGGRPVRGARVMLQGLLEPAARTDAEGRFSFSHVVPDVQALAAAPLRLVLRASHKGWNLALPTGESALAVELRLVRTGDGSARLEVRSNDAGVAKAAAASFGVPGDVTVALSAGFLKQLGAEDLTGPALSMLEIVQASPPAPATGAATATPARARADSVAAPALRPDSAMTARPVVVTAPVPPSRPPRPERMRLFPSAPEPDTTPGPGRQPRDTLPVRVAQEPRGAGPGRQPWDTLRVRVAQEPRGAGSGRQPRDTLRIRVAQEPRGPGSARGAPGTGAADTSAPRGIRVSVRPDTAALSAGSGGGTALRVALGRVLPDTQPAAPAGRACDCQVKGTVEVSRDRSLRVPLRVVVSLANSPAVRDTVVLYMGPPRPFDLGLVPCGPRRLEVQPLSSRRFTVAPPALALFDCRAGRTQQFRVILRPR